jgi:hypothetical protein
MHRGEARRIIAAHGRRAHQHVLDLMVAAMRGGEESEAKRYETLLREVESIRLGVSDRTMDRR